MEQRGIKQEDYKTLTRFIGKFSLQMSMLPVASFTEEVHPRLAKRPLKTNGRLANHGLTSLVKEATGSHCWCFFPATLFCNQVLSSYLKMKSTGTWSSNELQWLDLKDRCQDGHSSSGQWGNMPYLNSTKSGQSLHKFACHSVVGSCASILVILWQGNEWEQKKINCKWKLLMKWISLMFVQVLWVYRKIKNKT